MNIESDLHMVTTETTFGLNTDRVLTLPALSGEGS